MLYYVRSSLELVVVYVFAMRTEPLASVIHFVASPGVERAKHQHPTLGGSTDVGSNVGEDVSARRSKYVSRLYIGSAGVLPDERELVEFVKVGLTARQPAH